MVDAVEGRRQIQQTNQRHASLTHPTWLVAWLSQSNDISCKPTGDVHVVTDPVLRYSFNCRETTFLDTNERLDTGRNWPHWMYLGQSFWAVASQRMLLGIRQFSQVDNSINFYDYYNILWRLARRPVIFQLDRCQLVTEVFRRLHVCRRPMDTVTDRRQEFLCSWNTAIWNNLPTEIRRRDTFENYRRLLKARDST